MQSNIRVESIGKVIHKEKNQKKTTDISSDVSSPVDNSTNVQGITHVKSLPEKLEEHQNRQKSIGQKKLHDKERNARLIRNLEIDESLQGWVMEGLVDERFITWVAKCCHELTLETVNRIAIQSRNGKQPARLFSTLLSGSMKLKAKKAFYAIDTTNNGTLDEIGKNFS